MRVVDIRSVLRGFEAVLRLRCAVGRVRSDDDIGIVTTGHNTLIHIHIRHLQNESERIERVDVPIVADLEHIVLEIRTVSGTRITLNSRRFAVGLKLDIILRKDLRELPERVGLLPAIIKVERDHVHLQPTVDIAEVHTSVAGRQHTVQTFHHIAFGLDIDDTTLPACIVFGRRIGDDFDLLDGVSVRSVEHGLELLSAQVRRLSVHVYLDRFTVHGNVAVFVDSHTGRTTEDIISVRACRQGRCTHVDHQLVHLAFNQRFLGLHLKLFELFRLLAQDEVRPSISSMVAHIRGLDDILRSIDLYLILTVVIRDSTCDEAGVLGQHRDRHKRHRLAFRIHHTSLDCFGRYSRSNHNEES